MPKRKRDDTEEVIEKIEDRAVRIKASRLRVRVDQGNKSLKNAIQLAKGFERQKLGRRQKQASQDPKKLLRLREEVIITRELEPGQVARDYLFKQLAKTNKLRTTPAFIALYGVDPAVQAPKSVAEANVLGRLIKSTPVQAVLPNILKDIRQILEGERAPPAPLYTNNKANVPEIDVETNRGIGLVLATDDSAGQSDEDESREQKLRQELELDSSDEGVENIDLSMADHSSTESEGPQDGVMLDTVMSPHSPDHDRTNGLPPITSSGRITEHRSEDDGNIKSARKSSSGAFLPSLSLGGYYSGDSSSEGDGHDPDAFQAAAPHKNRRGQRARRRIAEAKHGKNAKHLLQQDMARQKPDRDSGWDLRRGAVDSSASRNKPRFEGRGPRRQDSSTHSGTHNANRATLGTTNTRAPKRVADTKADGPVHPSWEAARKKKLESSSVAFTGKKTTFD